MDDENCHFGSPNPITGFSDQLYNLSTYVKPYAKSLGVIFESGFMFNKQMKWNEVVNLLVLILQFVYTTLIGFASSYISGLLNLSSASRSLRTVWCFWLGV